MPQAASEDVTKKTTEPTAITNLMDNAIHGFNASALLEGGQKNFEAYAQCGTQWMKQTAALNSEIANFVSSRLKEDMQTAASIASCKTPEDFFKVQRKFIDNTFHQYADEASRMLSMTAEAAQDTLTPLEDRTTEVLQVFNGKDEN